MPSGGDGVSRAGRRRWVRSAWSSVRNGGQIRRRAVSRGLRRRPKSDAVERVPFPMRPQALGERFDVRLRGDAVTCQSDHIVGAWLSFAGGYACFGIVEGAGALFVWIHVISRTRTHAPGYRHARRIAVGLCFARGAGVTHCPRGQGSRRARSQRVLTGGLSDFCCGLPNESQALPPFARLG